MKKTRNISLLIIMMLATGCSSTKNVNPADFKYEKTTVNNHKGASKALKIKFCNKN